MSTNSTREIPGFRLHNCPGDKRYTHEIAFAEPYDLLAGLPNDYSLHIWSTMSTLRDAVKAVHDVLLDYGNVHPCQILLVIGLPEWAINNLHTNPKLLGVMFRFMWTKTTSLIKIIPPGPQDSIASATDLIIHHHLRSMGISSARLIWKRTGVNPPNCTTRGKQPDSSFYPPSRKPDNWPSFVIETSNEVGRSKLRRDATWWFQDSLGATRIVLLITVTSHGSIFFEKWQLAPPGFRKPENLLDWGSEKLSALHELKQVDRLPPIVQQPVAQQIAFRSQLVSVSAKGRVWRAPMVIPFQALMDRPPTDAERDIVLTEEDFRTITRFYRQDHPYGHDR